MYCGNVLRKEILKLTFLQITKNNSISVQQAFKNLPILGASFILHLEQECDSPLLFIFSDYFTDVICPQ